MKKFIAMLACLTMVLTMFAGLTVSAADYGTPTVTLTYTGDNSKGYAQISVKYSGFENFVAFDQDYYDSEGYSIVTGIAAMSANFTADNGAKYQGGAKKLCTVSTAASGVQSCNTFAQGFDSYITESTGEMAVIRYEITDKTKDTTITLTDAEFTVTAVVDDDIVDSKTYKFADVTVVPCVIPGATAADPVVTYEGEENLVWGAKGAYAEGKATFSVKPVMGYTIAVTANGTDVAIDAAKGGEVTIDVTEDTTVVATATAITDGAYTYGETYKDGNTVYVFGKAPGAANFGFYVEKDGAALANKALEIYDGYFAATSGSANAFGMAFAFTGKGHTGAYTAAAYGDADVATTTAAFNID